MNRIQPWDVKCPKCDQEKGLPCLRINGNSRKSCHIERWNFSKTNGLKQKLIKAYNEALVENDLENAGRFFQELKQKFP